MKKLKNKGFVIVETLIVAAFVLGIFTFIYVNVIPLIGIYEQRNTYDDLESVYNIDTIRDNIDLSGKTVNSIQTSGEFCGDDDLCESMLSAMEITNIGIIDINFTGTSAIKGLSEYLDYIGQIPVSEQHIIIVKQHMDQYNSNDEDVDGHKTYPVRFASLKKMGGV
jgi:hypothetical protein